MGCAGKEGGRAKHQEPRRPAARGERIPIDRTCVVEWRCRETFAGGKRESLRTSRDSFKTLIGGLNDENMMMNKFRMPDETKALSVDLVTEMTIKF